MPPTTDLPAHAAPPPWRPLSVLAILALVLAVLAIPAALGVAWWAPVLAIVPGAFALSRTGSGRARGRAVAWTAIGIAIASGALAFLLQRGFAGSAERHLDPLVRALAADDRDAAAPYASAAYATSGAGADSAAVALWVVRASAARTARGAVGDTVEVGNPFWSAYSSALVPPEGVVEFEPVGVGTIGPGDALWARVRHARGDVWYAFVFDVPGTERTPLDLEHASRRLAPCLEAIQGERVPPTWVGDVRIFAPAVAARRE